MKKNNFLKVADIQGSGNGAVLRIEATLDGSATRVTIMRTSHREGGRALEPAWGSVVMKPEEAERAARTFKVACENDPAPNPTIRSGSKPMRR